MREKEEIRAFNYLLEQSLVCWDQIELLDQKHLLLLLAVENIEVHVVVEDTVHKEVVDVQVELVADSHILQGSNVHTNYRNLCLTANYSARLSQRRSFSMGKLYHVHSSLHVKRTVWQPMSSRKNKTLIKATATTKTTDPIL